MQFQNEITVDAPPDEVFAAVSDVERVAPCLPGASIDGRDGDEYRGSMKVKVGPILAQYRGVLQFDERDEQGRRAVMRARAEEVNGQGNAEARIHTAIDEDGDGSRIRVETDLQIRGRVAQFGRGAMEKIAQRMFAEFAGNLERSLNGDGPSANGASPDKASAGGEAQAERAESPSSREDRLSSGGGDDGVLDAGSLIGGPVLQAAAPVLQKAGPLLVALGYGYLLGRLRSLKRLERQRTGL